MNTGTEQARRLVDIMMCSHTSKRISGIVTVCNQCGLVFDRAVTLRGVIGIMVKVGQDIALDITECRVNRTSICKHTEKEFDGGTPFCTGCGLVFEDETVYSNGYIEDVNHHPTYEYKHDTNTQSVEMYNGSHTPRRTDEGEVAVPTVETSDIPNKVAQTSTKNIHPRTKKDLIIMAKDKGIKCTTLMSKKKLCEALGIDEQEKPNKILLTNSDTGEEHRFVSTYQASKEMGASPATIKYCIGRDMIINEVVYTVSEI